MGQSLEQVVLFNGVLNAMRNAATKAYPNEACGLLLGSQGRITAFQPAANVHKEPAKRFEIDPQALIDAYRSERDGGLQVLGYFHSHPKGAPVPSAIDIEMAAHDGKIWAIFGQEELRLWRDERSGFHPLSYEFAND